MRNARLPNAGAKASEQGAMLPVQGSRIPHILSMCCVLHSALRVHISCALTNEAVISIPNETQHIPVHEPAPRYSPQQIDPSAGS